MAAYTAKVVERGTGTPIRTLVKANVRERVEELNGEGGVVFTIPKKNPAGAAGQLAAVAILDCEVMVWRDSTLIAWGVPLRREASSGRGDVEFNVPGVGWYLKRLYVDAPITNFLSNPEFENDLTSWSAEGGVTPTVITSPRRLGAKAVRLEQATSGGDAFLRQQMAITSGSIGTAVRIAGHYHIETWNGPAIDSRGLYLEGFVGGVQQTIAVDVIDASAPRSQWGRAETFLWIPPNETWDLFARLYAPNGSIVWDACRVVIYESTGFFDGDIGDLATLLVQDVQDPAKGKLDLGIGTDTPTTGIEIPSKWWQWIEHHPFRSALSELVERNGGGDWSIEITDTPSPARTFTFHHPRKGTDRTATVTLSLGSNVASYGLVDDGATVETAVTVYGDGDGPDREEVQVTDTAAFSGLILQGVYQAPPGTTVDQLEPQAQGRLDVGKEVGSQLTVVTYQGAGDLVALLKTGDTVTVDIDDEDISIDGTWRITRIKHFPRTETLELRLVKD